MFRSNISHSKFQLYYKINQLNIWRLVSIRTIMMN